MIFYAQVLMYRDPSFNPFKAYIRMQQKKNVVIFMWGRIVNCTKDDIFGLVYLSLDLISETPYIYTNEKDLKEFYNN